MRRNDNPAESTPDANSHDSRARARDSSGTTHSDQQEIGKGPVPRTPNEHDTSADSQAGKQPGGNAIGKAAHSDAASNRQDTDRGPEMNRVYNNEVRDGEPKGGPRR